MGAAKTQSSTSPPERRSSKKVVPGPRDPEALQPFEGEALSSWITTLAEDRDIAVKQLLREFHLHKHGALSMGETRLDPPVARRISRLTGVDEQALHAMTLARYAGNALPHLPLSPEANAKDAGQWHSSAWLCDRRIRWCPRCLRENDGRWPLRWLLPWTFACLKHSVYLESECQRCQSVVTFGRLNSVRPQHCDAQTADERFRRYGYDETCDFPLAMSHPLRVRDDTVLALQTRINEWLDGVPTVDDRQLVSLTAVLIMLLSPSMLRRGDPILLFAIRSLRAPRPHQKRELWTDPLRVAAAACAADRILERSESAAQVARQIADLRIVDYRVVPWELDVMDWAYGPALRPNPYLEELVKRHVITVGDFRYH